ncbi:class I SAM-dependent methyltransferase [Amycolatopsis nigrescens]|uniref:class I SAM-dependent methyltransferase n=1 Tax=Amycolatopsis nigrescens TaxID=381445 RepID=UPI00039C07D2|nr:class I SAM-dependent methyltransferase [Amycolatopsis nigrescens]
MVNPKVEHPAGELVGAFAGAGPEEIGAAFARLAAATWNGGEPTGSALGVAREVVSELDRFDERHQGHLAILLGLLAEAAYPDVDGELTASIRLGVDRYLELWRRTEKGQPLNLALQYLLSHFPDHRDAILAAAAELRVDADDLSRLDRALQRLDPADPDLGRAFPYPAAWEMDEDEREFDRSWISALSPEQVVRHWEQDTETVLGHTGAKAYWAVCNGAPVPAVADSIPPRSTRQLESDSSVLSRHAAVFRCLSCHSGLTFHDRAATCAGCSTEYRLDNGILNFTATAGDSADRSDDFLFKLAEMPSMGFFYEAHARPNFLRLCGSNWGGQVTPADEDDYLARNVSPVDGPVLDLAAGAGRWTAVLAEAVGTDRLIAMDLGLPMLATLRGRLPEVPAVLASARTLPFGDATLGAVNCWNALQAFPADAPAAIVEVGRCLRPGGTFTLLTFRNSDDPIYRYFVYRHHFPQHADGLHLFERDDVKGWLADAGLTIRDEWDPGTFVIITAERPA